MRRTIAAKAAHCNESATPKPIINAEPTVNSSTVLSLPWKLQPGDQIARSAHSKHYDRHYWPASVVSTSFGVVLIARLYRVSGRVQGVGFRWFVQRSAEELGLTGYVKNLPDGDVEVYAIGTEKTLSKLEQRLRKGPAYSDVRSVNAQNVPVQKSGSFRIEPSW